MVNGIYDVLVASNWKIFKNQTESRKCPTKMNSWKFFSSVLLFRKVFFCSRHLWQNLWTRVREGSSTSYPSANALDHWSRKPSRAEIGIADVLLRSDLKDKTPGGSSHGISGSRKEDSYWRGLPHQPAQLGFFNLTWRGICKFYAWYQWLKSWYIKEKGSSR